MKAIVSFRLRAIGYWAAAPALMLVLYWPGLTSWFQKDDFAWLGLRSHVHNLHDLAWALFAPMAQGTIRTLSERAVFLSFTSLLGLHSLPFRCLAFATCIGAVSMLCAVATKLSGSRAAGFWAAIIWTLNGAIAIPLAWASIYNELAWPFWLLLTFWLLLRYVETGEQRFYIAQCVTFVLGFFILETNVVYPAIAALYAILSPEAVKRGLLKKVAPLFAISAVYTAVHIYVAPLPVSGPYKLHWDFRILETLIQYWGSALGPGQGRLIEIRSTLIRASMVWTLTLGLFAFLVRKDWRAPGDKQIMAILFPAWFLILLAPMLPLRDHISPEYLTAPTLGLAMWAGWAIVAGWRANVALKIGIILLVVIYAGFSIPIGQAHVRSFYDRSQRIRNFVLSVVDASRTQPGKMVLLSGVDTELFNNAIYHGAFPLFGIQELHIVPENKPAIHAAFDFEAIDAFFVDPVIERDALRQDRAMVLDVSTGTARDVTSEYARSH